MREPNYYSPWDDEESGQQTQIKLVNTQPKKLLRLSWAEIWKDVLQLDIFGWE